MSDPIRALMTGSGEAPGEDCLSDLALDRLALGELPEDEAARARAHLATCARCQGRREPGPPLLDAADRARMVRAIVTGPKPRLAPRLLGPLALAASIAAVVLLSDHPEQTRAKSGLVFEVYRERAGEVVRASSGDTFHPGDRLEFMVSYAEPREVMVIGREASGAVFAAYPADGTNRSRPTRGGKRELLPGAVALDETLGKEELHLVACSAPFAISDVRTGGGAPVVPGGCAVASFVLSKEPRP